MGATRIVGVNTESKREFEYSADQHPRTGEKVTIEDHKGGSQTYMVLSAEHIVEKTLGVSNLDRIKLTVEKVS